MTDRIPTASRAPKRAVAVEDDDEEYETLWDEIRPYCWQTIRNVVSVVVSAVVLAVMFRMYLWLESERQMDALKAGREQAVQRNLAKQAEIQKDLDRLDALDKRK